MQIPSDPFAFTLSLWHTGEKAIIIRLFCICSWESSYISFSPESLGPYSCRCPGIAQVGFSPSALSMPQLEQDALSQDELQYTASVFPSAWWLQQRACLMGLPYGSSCAAPSAAGMRNFSSDLLAFCPWAHGNTQVVCADGLNANVYVLTLQIPFLLTQEPF